MSAATKPQPSARQRPPSRRSTAIAVSVATALWLAASLAGAFLAVFSVFLFDAPGSTEQPGTVALAMAMVAFPLTCWLTIPLCWLLWGVRQYVASLACTALPLVPLTVAAGAWAWIEVVQHGVFGR